MFRVSHLPKFRGAARNGLMCYLRAQRPRLAGPQVGMVLLFAGIGTADSPHVSSRSAPVPPDGAASVSQQAGMKYSCVFGMYLVR